MLKHFEMSSRSCRLTTNESTGKHTRKQEWRSELVSWEPSVNFLAWATLSTGFGTGMKLSQQHGCSVSRSITHFCSSFVFMRYKSDWAYTSVYDCLYKRNLQKIAKKEKFDLQKAKALQDYLEELERKLKAVGVAFD